MAFLPLFLSLICSLHQSHSWTADRELNSTQWQQQKPGAARQMRRQTYRCMEQRERQEEKNKKIKQTKKRNLWRRRDDGGLSCDWRDWDHRDYGRGGRGGIRLLNNSMVRGQRLDKHSAAQMSSRRSSGGEDGRGCVRDTFFEQLEIPRISPEDHSIMASRTSSDKNNTGCKFCAKWKNTQTRRVPIRIF